MGRVGGRVAKALAQWAGGRPFCFFARAGRVGVEILSSKTGWAWVGARARPALSEVLEIFQMRSPRFPSSDDCKNVLLPRLNIVRNQRGQLPLDWPALRKAILIWRQKHPGYELVKTETFITEFVNSNGYLPSTNDCKMRLLAHINQVQRQRGQDEISLRGLREALSRWRQTHPDRARMATDGDSREERANTASHRERWVALPEADRQEARAANTASQREHRDALPEKPKLPTIHVSTIFSRKRHANNPISRTVHLDTSCDS
jgi:hypothetical protein